MNILVNGYSQTTFLTKKQVQQDLNQLKKILDEKSSYVYLNGYDFNKDLQAYENSLEDSVNLENFGLFLSNTIGKIGDRHSSVRNYETRDSLYLPLIYAPLNNNVAVLKRGNDKNFELFNEKYHYLKSIDGIPINEYLTKILPKELSAPKNSYFTLAVREIRDIQKNYKTTNTSLPTTIKISLYNPISSQDTTLTLIPVGRKGSSRLWDEKFESDFRLVNDKDYDQQDINKNLFKISDSIGYIHIPTMLSKDDAPEFFDKINSFMLSIEKQTKALIVDVRGNGGGTRDLIYEFAKYFIHPDSIYVVNATKQRSDIPLIKDDIENLNSRRLFTYSTLDKNEKRAVDSFLKSFSPMYNLESKKYSEYYFGLLNGLKLSKAGYFYSRPIYILANEKSFSAASVFVSAFKGLPNIQIVGVTTDGSSGNSDRYQLSNSGIAIKISTMVSFQKDGKILDGFGTEPDIILERDIDQILWKSDSQLNKLKEIISQIQN